MHFYSTLISSILFVSGVLADNQVVVGGVNLTSPNESTFKTVETAVKIPHVSGQPFDSAALTVSLDGGSDCAFFAQVGVNFEVGSDTSENVYFAWYEVANDPNLKQGIFNSTKVPINAGGTYVVGLTAPYRDSTTDVYVYIESSDTGDRDFYVVPNLHQPCGTNAAWLMNNIPYTEDPTQYHDVCNFGTLELTTTSAYDPTGDSYGPQGLSGPSGVQVNAKEDNMSYDNGTTVAVTTTSGNSINFAYVYDQIP